MGENREIADTALQDVRIWLGFSSDYDYLRVLEIEQERIFERACD